MILKTGLHFHANNDEKFIGYNIYQGIDCAREKGFDVLAYTPHRKFLFRDEYAKYAENKGILLIPGIEMEIGEKHIVVLNCDKEIENVKSFGELSEYKNKNPQILILAAHPFVFSTKSLQSKLLENITLFDAIEMTVFSNNIFNFNKKAAEIALKYGKPFIATSDVHFLKDIERGYVLIDTKNKTITDILSSIKIGHFQNKMNSMGPMAMLEMQVKSRFFSIFRPKPDDNQAI